MTTPDPDRDDRPQIHRALAALRRSTGLPLAFGGPVDGQRRVWLTEFAGSTVGALRGVALGFGLGLGGRVVARRRPLTVNDYVRARGISHQYDRIIATEGLRGMAAAPVVVGGRVRGVLYGAVRDAAPLGDRAVGSVWDCARDLEQRLAVGDEIGRRLDWLDRRAGEGRDGAARWELVREAYAELRLLTGATADTALRRRFDTVCRKLSAAAGAPPPEAPSSVRPAGPPPALSERELDVLACVALGCTNPQVAADLGVRRETVKSYLRSAMHKLGAHSRWDAVVTARRLGLLP